jgi:hypothetical protein
MVIKRIGNESHASRQLGAKGWQRGNSYNRCDNGRVRETRAELVSPKQSWD